MLCFKFQNPCPLRGFKIKRNGDGFQPWKQSWRLSLLEFATLVLHHWDSWTISPKFESCRWTKIGMLVQGSVGLTTHGCFFEANPGVNLQKNWDKSLRAVSSAGGDASRVPWQPYNGVWSAREKEREREPGTRNSLDSVHGSCIKKLGQSQSTFDDF